MIFITTNYTAFPSSTLQDLDDLVRNASKLMFRQKLKTQILQSLEETKAIYLVKKGNHYSYEEFKLSLPPEQKKNRGAIDFQKLRNDK